MDMRNEFHQWLYEEVAVLKERTGISCKKPSKWDACSKKADPRLTAPNL